MASVATSAGTARTLREVVAAVHMVDAEVIGVPGAVVLEAPGVAELQDAANSGPQF